MMLRFGWVVGVLLGGVSVTGLAAAQEAEPEAAPAATTPAVTPSVAASSDASLVREPAGEGHASGLMVQARVQSNASLLSVATGGTGFLVGYQGPAFGLGLGLGLSRIGVDSGGQSVSATLFQVAPTAIIDVWHSADGRARANLVGSVGFARASLSSTGTTTQCTSNGTGADVCTDSSRDDSVSATLIPVMLGFGGDYYLSRNFALGAEFGVQAMFLASASANSGSNSKSVDAGGNAQFAYGALRATFVLGD